MDTAHTQVRGNFHIERVKVAQRKVLNKFRRWCTNDFQTSNLVLFLCIASSTAFSCFNNSSLLPLESGPSFDFTFLAFTGDSAAGAGTGAGAATSDLVLLFSEAAAAAALALPASTLFFSLSLRVSMRYVPPSACFPPASACFALLAAAAASTFSSSCLRLAALLCSARSSFVIPSFSKTAELGLVVVFAVVSVSLILFLCRLILKGSLGLALSPDLSPFWSLLPVPDLPSRLLAVSPGRVLLDFDPIPFPFIPSSELVVRLLFFSLSAPC